MDVGLTNIWIENPLQHDSTKLHELSGKSDLVQKQRIQHKLIAKHNAQIGRRMQKNIDEKNDEDEWNKKKKKKAGKSQWKI